MNLDEQGYSLLEITLALCLLLLFSTLVISTTAKISNLTESVTRKREFSEAAQSLGIEYLENLYYKNVVELQVNRKYSWQELNELNFELTAHISEEIKEEIEFSIELLTDDEEYNLYQLILSLSDMEITFFYLDDEAGVR